jgi:hypothetical protein
MRPPEGLVLKEVCKRIWNDSTVRSPLGPVIWNDCYGHYEAPSLFWRPSRSSDANFRAKIRTLILRSRRTRKAVQCQSQSRNYFEEASPCSRTPSFPETPSHNPLPNHNPSHSPSPIQNLEETSLLT